MSIEYDISDYESRTARLFNDEAVRRILYILWDGIISRQEIIDMGDSANDKARTEKTLATLEEMGIISTEKDSVYMIRDIEIFKTLPIMSVENTERMFSADILKTYKENIMTSFEKNGSIDVPQMSIPLTDENMYRLLCVLRRAPIKMSEIGTTLQMSKEMAKDIVDKMMKHGIAMTTDIDRDRWVFLLYDVRSRTFFPDHFMRMYNMLSRDTTMPDGMRRHIDVLMENFPK